MESETTISILGNESLVETLPLAVEETCESIEETSEIEEKPSVVELIITEEPAGEEPSTEEPIVEEPSTEEPGVEEEPATEEPATEEPAAEEHTVEDEPSTEEPVVEEPSTEEPATEEPSAEEPTVEEHSTEEPSAEEPTVEEHSTEEPVVEDEPSTEEPAVEEEPSTEEPATEEPSAEEPTVEDEPSTEEEVVAEEPVVDEKIQNLTSQISHLNHELEFVKINNNHQEATISDLTEKLSVATYIKPKPRIFLSYVYFTSDHADHNLRFFIQRELLIYNNENIDYIIVINGHDCKDINFPERPNVIVLRRDNIGYDFGGHKHALEHCHGKQYDYYFFMNSGVFGPIMPSYFTHEHWSNIFIRKINDRVKLVGTTIVCLPHHDLGGYGPKVEGFFFLTDNIGLQLLKDEGSIFYDHPDFVSDIVNGEYGISNCILRHGYSLDCMIRKYQGIDWRDQNNWTLNNNIHPTRKNSFFGESLNPYELIFHKWIWKDSPPVQFDIVRQYTNNNI